MFSELRSGFLWIDVIPTRLENGDLPRANLEMTLVSDPF